MIIKVIPETAEEAKAFTATEHSGVKEFFMCGVEQDEEGHVSEFHDWKGGYKFLIGNLAYYKEVIADERRSKQTSGFNPNMLRVMPPAGAEMPETEDPKAAFAGQPLKMVTADVQEPKVEVITDLPEPGHDLEEDK